MREPYTQLYVHLVWATWDRLPLLVGESREGVYACVQSECNALKTDLIALGGIEDHLHALVRTPPTVAVATLVKQLKGASSHMVTHKMGQGEAFKWQGGYGAFTVCKTDVPHIRSYILNQEEHHRDQTTLSDFEFQA